MERWRHWRVLHPTMRQRRKLHDWLTYMAKVCPEAGLAPCGYGSSSICECHKIATLTIDTRTGYEGCKPRRPDPEWDSPLTVVLPFFLSQAKDIS